MLRKIFASMLFRLSGKYRLRRKVERLNERLRKIKDELTHHQQEIATLRSSYYLKGEGKKFDIRELDGFADIARQVILDGKTGMGYDRLYTIWQALQAAPVGLPIIEIGTYRGGSAKFICEAQRYAGHPSVFYVCDTFSGHPRVDASLDHVRHLRPNFTETSTNLVAQYLTGYPELEIVAGDIIDTSDRLPEGPYGFVHIDVDVYPAMDFCVRFFAPRLGPGAVIVIDDYGFVTCPGIKKAVDDFITADPRFRLFHLLTGQALLFEAARTPSQLWHWHNAFRPSVASQPPLKPISVRQGAA